MADDADVIIVGAGLAGLVAAAELAEAGRRTLIVEQEPEQALGGQAFWSLGGLFLVNSPEQRRLRIHDSHALALQDWMGTAAFDREEDHWPRAWAEAYVDFAAGEKRRWLTARGLRLFPVVGWAERGGYNATGHGNSVPRFHIAWGTGHGVLAPFLARVQAAAADGRTALRFRHRVDELIATAGTITGVRGSVLEPSAVERGRPSSRGIVGQFELRAQAVIVSSGGIGGNHALLDPRAGPLIAVRLWVLTRKTLGGLQTDLDSRVLGGAGAAARPVPGLYAAGEAAGFGGGGMHGYRALEGTFLGGCIFSGRAAGRAAAKAVG